jgi:LacI family transcriptional regulator
MKPIVGIILPSSMDLYCAELAKGIEDAVSDAGFYGLIGFSHEDSEIEIKLLKAMFEADFQGVIVVPAGFEQQELESYLHKRMRKAAASQTQLESDQCSVSSDQVRGGFLGIQYLHGLGHKKITWVSGPEHHRRSNERLLGISQAARELGVELTTIVAPSLDLFSGESIASQIISLGPLPDAIFAVNDAVALGIINSLVLAGIKVPQDISVLGFDNTLPSESALIPLSTISQTPYQLGHIMGEQLITDLFDHSGHVHERVIFPSEVVERASTCNKAEIAV